MSLAPIDLATLERAAAGPEWERLRHVVRTAGAFALTGHGGSETATVTLLQACRAFFTLPQAELDAIDMLHSPYFRGYSAAGTERTQGRPDVREQFDVGPEERPHPMQPGEPPWLRLRGPNLWPAAQPELRAVILTWMEQSRAVATRLMAAIVESIGLPRDAFGAGFSGAPHERLKVIRYPPAGSLVVILGRALQATTGGRTHAVRHRVVSPAPSGERISVAYFLNPRLDHDGYGDEALRVVLRSHPQTAQRYFADLTIKP